MTPASEIGDRLLRDLRAAGVSEHRARRGDLEARQVRPNVKGARHRYPSELHRLCGLGKIDGRQLAAGQRYYRDWYHSGFAALAWPAGPGDSIRAPSGVTPGRGATGPDYLEASRVLQQRGWMIVAAVVHGVATAPRTVLAGSSAPVPIAGVYPSGRPARHPGPRSGIHEQPARAALPCDCSRGRLPLRCGSGAPHTGPDPGAPSVSPVRSRVPLRARGRDAEGRRAAGVWHPRTAHPRYRAGRGSAAARRRGFPAAVRARARSAYAGPAA